METITLEDSRKARDRPRLALALRLPPDNPGKIRPSFDRPFGTLAYGLLKGPTRPTSILLGLA